MSIEELLIKKIEGGIRAIKNGSKSPQTAEIGGSLNKLKQYNEGMHLDLMNNYKKAVEDYNKKNPKKD